MNDKFTEQEIQLAERQAKIDAEAKEASELQEALNGRLESLEARRRSLLLPSKADKKAAAELDAARAEIAQLLPQINSVNNQLADLGAQAAGLRGEAAQLHIEKLLAAFRQAEFNHCQALLNFYNANVVMERTRALHMLTNELLLSAQADLAKEKLPIPNGGFSLPTLSMDNTIDWLNKKIKEISPR